MSVREGEPGDLPRLRAIQSAALEEPWPELLATAVDGPPPLYVVADGTPLGYAVVVPGTDVAYVPELAVHPDHQRDGHGSRLLGWLRERYVTARDGQLRLTVRADDGGARAFYADHGFAVVDRLDGYFETGDGLVLALPPG